MIASASVVRLSKATRPGVDRAHGAGDRGKKEHIRYSGDDSIRVPPLPIPNREVKPYHADGTAKAGE